MASVYESEEEMGTHPELETELEDELEGEWEGELENEFEGEGEFEEEGETEFEGEGEGEWESEISPIRKVYADAMMEHLGALAAESESEEEAVDRFLPLIGMAATKLLPMAAKALAPMAKKALPRILKSVTRVSPQLTRGIGTIARKFYRQPAARRLLRTVPAIARRTVHSLARQALHHRRITPRIAVRTLAQQTQRVLRNPRRRRHVLRRHYHLDRQFHRHLARGVATPHGRLAAAGVPASVGGQPATSSVRYGRVVSGRCVCSSCPTCGAERTQAGAVSAPAPSYCRCCGQLIR